ncbi:hypothetical protein MUP77_25965 [Candidatus Bathyarchaeota archaeon]|nr:hypothetical protein [Candidatus Bathyarchaeota archaeon]
MKEFVESLSSPAWWIGVVVVGILINIASAYLKPRIDTTLAGISVWSSQRTQKRKEHREKLIELLAKNPQKQLIFAHRAMRHLERSNGFMLQSIILVVLGSLFRFVVSVAPLAYALWFIAAVAVMMSLDDYRCAWQIGRIVDSLNDDIEL